MAKRIMQNTTHHKDGTVTSQVYAIKTDEPEFIKMYCDRLTDFKRLSPMCSKVLMALAMRCDYENKISTGSYDRKQIANAIDTTPDTIRNSIYQLEKAGFVLKLATSYYELSPKYFVKKAWAEVKQMRKAFELRLRYSSDKGEEVSVYVDEDGVIEAEIRATPKSANNPSE